MRWITRRTGSFRSSHWCLRISPSASCSDGRFGVTDAAISGDDIGATVHIDGPACDATGECARKISTGKPDIHDVHELAERRFLRSLIEEQLEVLQARRGAC